MRMSMRDFGIVSFLIIGLFGYVSMSGDVFAAASAGVPQQQKTTTKGTNQARMATASVTIHSFYKEVPSGRMMASTGGAPSTRVIATYGDKVTFSWRFNACNANAVTVNLSSVGNVEPGTRTDLGNQCVQYRGSQEVTLTEDRTYTLRVSAFPGGPNSVAEKSLQVELKRYGLVMEEPTLDTSTREVKFYARNNGDLDIPENTIMVYYRITGVVRGGPGASIVSDWVNRSRLAIPRGQRVMLGNLHLPESASVYRQMNVRFRVFGDRYGFGDNTQNFSLFWERKQLKFNRVILEALISSIIGDVRFNNYDPSMRTGELSPRAPFKRNDSWVEILGERSTFTPDEIRLALEISGSATGHVYKTY
ncbi:MAG: hypothetical protein JXA62_02580, partial [Candidatus Aminicenantes bacterium]|nr:hypothetical protein [Candidatus Aminicenantes bacterium]